MEYFFMWPSNDLELDEVTWVGFRFSRKSKEEGYEVSVEYAEAFL